MGYPGVFITLEGPEGSGKSTQVTRLATFLEDQGYAPWVVREPGSTAIGEAIREILHDPANREMHPQTEFLLFSAARAQLVRQTILPALQAGKLVLADRFADSSLAYQGYGRGLDLKVLRRITAFATEALVPSLTLYLDLPVEAGLARKQRAHRETATEWNRLDAEAIAFHERVRQSYLEMARAEPGRWVIVDATQPAEAVQAELRRTIEERGVLKSLEGVRRLGA